VIGTGVLAFTGQKPTLCPNAFGTSWFTIPPVLLLMATGEKSFAWHSWPLYALAVLVQSLADLGPAAIYERVVNNTDLRPLAGVLATVYGFDVLLTPVGMLAAAEGGFAFLALLPFTVLLWLLSRERVNRLQAESLAHIDDLTGGANRRSFDERLVVEQARSSRSGVELSICMIDLDHFKTFNDTHGHQAGDLLLKQAAARWSAELRATDLLARYGGEEFALALPGVSPDAAEEIIDRLRRATPQEESCSAGAVWWDGSESPSELLGRADAALYAAKGAGRARTVFA
jgi:diguanylate cyclase (GGDEF)-like protein